MNNSTVKVYIDGLETISNRPVEANEMKRKTVKYKGLITGINPALTFMRTANKDFEATPDGNYPLFPVRVLVCFNREYNYKKETWEKIFNSKSASLENVEYYFFEHLWAAVPESVCLNDESGLSLSELLARCEKNTKRGIKNIITKCTLTLPDGNLIPLDFSHSKNLKVLSKLEIRGLGPLYPRIHKGSNQPFKGDNNGEILYHLDSPRIRLLKQVVIKQELNHVNR